MHNVTKTLVAMSLLAPLTAHSLGVGDIKLHSALNQKLNAEIALSLATDENLEDVTVTLAGPDKFDKLGIAWSYFLSKVKFQPILKSNGKVVIKMTSDAVVEEPFLDFLVEVSWPKGDIFKEFTVLVDPPVVYQRTQISTPEVASTTRYVEPRARTSGVSKKYQTRPSSVVDGIYGPTGRKDSLWKVAERVNKDSDVSVHQMMIALYEANPRAFYKKNINALMVGKKLKVPERSSIIRLTQKQANNKFNGQMAAWSNKSTPNTPKKVRTQSVEQEQINEQGNSKLRLAPPIIDDIRSSEALTANATNSVELEHLATENLQLQERLADMEQEFVNLQEILAIKDQQLATMQNIGIVEKPAEDISQRVSDPVETNVHQDNSSNNISVAEPVVKKGVVKPTEPVVTPIYKTPKDPVTAEPESNYFYVGLGIFGALALAGLGGLLWHRRQSEEEINENSMFASSSEIFLPDTDETEEELDIPVFDGKSSYDVGTVGESSFLSEFTPSDFDVFETDQGEIDPTSETDVYLAYGRYQQAEELMRQAITDYPDKDEYKLKLLEIFYTSENSEGYEKFAGELAAQGKSVDLNFWAKVTDMGGELLPSSTLFLSEQSASDFSADDNPDDLSNLNNDDESSAPSFGLDKEQSTDNFPDLNNGDIPSDGLFNLNNDEPSVADMSVSGENDIESDDNHSEIDFDLSALSLDEDNKSNESSKLSMSPEKEADEIESVDFDLSSFSPIKPDEEDIAEREPDSFKVDVAEQEQSDTETLELNVDDVDDISLDDFNFLEETTDSKNKKSENEPQLADESGISDFDFDFDEISGGVASKTDESSQDANTEDDYDLMVADLTDMDEFETKIDLAKAYIDMGDESVAKDIAQEVLDKGNTAQRNDAQEILDKLS